MLIILVFLTHSMWSQNTQISFVIKNFGIDVDGAFSKSKVSLGQDSLGNITDIKGEVLVATIETGITKRDKHLLEKDYFDALKYPQILLESTSVKPLGNNAYQINAELSIKGTTKSITIRGRRITEGGRETFQSEFEINRRDFDVGGGGFLGKTVTVKVVHFLKP